MTHEPRYVREFAELFQRLGERSFLAQWNVPVLVGSGIVGEVAQHKLDKRRTHAMMGDIEYLPVQTLLDRVWPLRRTNRVRPDRYIAVGEAMDCDVVIPEYTLSSRHCAFTAEGPLEVADLGSLNGTKLNGQQLQPRQRYRVANGSQLAMARIVFVCFTAIGFVAHLQTVR
jgi:hypothetical protein